MNKDTFINLFQISCFIIVVTSIIIVPYKLFINKRNELPIQIKEIDSCEYIVNKTYGVFTVYTHKGNCKFCAERNRRWIEKN